MTSVLRLLVFDFDSGIARQLTLFAQFGLRESRCSLVYQPSLGGWELIAPPWGTTDMCVLI